MTIDERNYKIDTLKGQLISLSSKMKLSDAHASKCVKLGLVYKDEYPEEYVEYVEARESYNSIETQIKQLELLEIEEPVTEEIQ